MVQEYKVTRVIDSQGDVVTGEYEYRGIKFCRDDSRKGYWGHYRTLYRVGGMTRITTRTRKELIRQIDLHFLHTETQKEKS